SAATDFDGDAWVMIICQSTNATGPVKRRVCSGQRKDVKGLVRAIGTLGRDLQTCKLQPNLAGRSNTFLMNWRKISAFRVHDPMRSVRNMPFLGPEGVPRLGFVLGCQRISRTKRSEQP